MIFRDQSEPEPRSMRRTGLEKARAAIPVARIRKARRCARKAEQATFCAVLRKAGSPGSEKRAMAGS